MEAVVRALAPLGFVLTEDYLPTRAVLRTSDGRQVDLHPVGFDEEGVGWQEGAMPDGGDCPYPPDGLTSGRLLGRVVPCITAELQVAHHSGYDPTDVDRADMAALAAVFSVSLPEQY
jgi:lincosamide nucleotidyltransferase A/C/D/E